MTYLELIAAIAAAEKEQGIDKLDSVSREIIQTVASANMMNVRMRMKDLSKVATFPTIHTHLKMLIDDGWITREEDATDKRVALLRITPRTQETLQKISDTLDSPPGHIRRGSCESCISKIRSLAFSEFERKYREFEKEFKERAQAPAP